MNGIAILLLSELSMDNKYSGNLYHTIQVLVHCEWSLCLTQSQTTHDIQSPPIMAEEML